MELSIDRNKWRVLLNRDFFLLTFGRVGSAFGSEVFTISLIWWMLEKEGAGSAGFVTALSLAGAVVLRPLGGVFVDRIDRRRALVAADMFGAVFVGILAVATATGTLGFVHFIAAIIVTSFASAIISPSTRSLIGELLDDDELTAGNSVISSLTNIASLAGPGLAGALLAVFSYELVFILNAVSFAFAAVAEFFITTTSSESVTGSDGNSVFADLREGLGYIRSNNRVRRIMMAAVSVNFFAAPLLLVGPALIEKSGYSAFYAGLTQALFAGGAALAGFVLIVVAETDSVDVWETEVFGGLTFVGSVFLVAAVVIFANPELLLPVVLVMVLFVGTGSGVAEIKSNSIIQASVPDEQMGRTFSVLKAIGNVAMPVSIAVTGVVVEATQPVEVLFVLAAGVILTVVLVGYRQVYALVTSRAISPDGEIISREAGD